MAKYHTEVLFHDRNNQIKPGGAHRFEIWVCFSRSIPDLALTISRSSSRCRISLRKQLSFSIQQLITKCTPCSGGSVVWATVTEMMEREGERKRGKERDKG